MTRTARTRLAPLLALVVAMLLNGVPLAGATPDGWTVTRTRRYNVGDVGPLGSPPMLAIGGCYEGSACFGSHGGDTFSVRIVDDSGRRVGGVIHISTDWGSWNRAFCGSTGPIPLTPGNLRVFLDAPGDVRGTHWYGGPGCAEIRPLGGTQGATTMGATSGLVRITYKSWPR